MSKNATLVFRVSVIGFFLAFGLLVGRVAVSAEPETITCNSIVDTWNHRLRAVKPVGPPTPFYRVMAIATCKAVRVEAEAQGVPVEAALAVAVHETHLDPFAIGPDGEIGPLQAKSLHCEEADGCNPIEAGVRYLRELGERADGDYGRVYAAYRCGWAGSASWAPKCREYSETLIERQRRIQSYAVARAERPRRPGFSR